MRNAARNRRVAMHLMDVFGVGTADGARMIGLKLFEA
jgi:hypothetical protein